MNSRSSRIFFFVFFMLFISFWFLTSVGSRFISKTKTTQEWDGTSAISKSEKNYQKVSLISKIIKKEAAIDKRITIKNSQFYNVVLLTKLIDKYCYNYNLTTSISNVANDVNIWDDVVVSRDGEMLTYIVDNNDDDYQINAVLDFKKILENQYNVPLVIFMPPGKDSGIIDDSYLGIYVDNVVSDRRKLITQLSDAKISFIDFSEKLEAEGMNEDEIFFRTDHHWLPQAALMACKELGVYLNTQGFSIDNSIFDESNYRLEWSDAKMLGTQGRKATPIYTDYEKLPIIHPLYDSDLTVFNSKLNATVQGTIEETLFDYSRIVGGNPLRDTRYQFYGYGDRAYIGIHNNLKPDGKRILVIKESFADCMIPYMSNMAENIDVIDLRHFKGSLQSMISKNQPDIVVMVYGARAFFYSKEVDSTIDPFNFD